MPGRDRDSVELTAVAPLIAVVGDEAHLLGAATLIEHAGKTVGVTSAELLRPYHGEKFGIVVKLDGSRAVTVTNMTLGRYAGLGLLEVGAIPRDADVKPLTIDHVCATTDTRGAPAGIVTIVPVGTGYARSLIAVHVDQDDGGGMIDATTRLASPVEPAHVDAIVEGAPLFAWFPPNPALGRPSEVLAVALAYPYRARVAKPRELPVIAELVGLDDVGRALIPQHAHEARPDLPQVTGEIEDKPATDPLAGFDE